MILTHMRPVFRGLQNWIRTSAGDRLRYGATYALSAANGLLFLVVVAALIGSPAIAALRGSASVMGPLSVLLASLNLVAVPEFRRMADASPAEYWRPMRKVATLLCIIPIVVGVLSIYVPDSWGEVLLGPTWSVAQPLLPVTAVQYVALTWNYSADVILTSQANSRAVLALQVVHALAITGAATIAAIAFGTAFSVAVGLAVGVTLSTVYGVVRTLDQSRVPRPQSRPS